MTFWLIVAAVVFVGLALAWWTSGRAKPDSRRRSIATEMEIRLGKDQDRPTRYGPFGR
jgi:hypothetical protein